MAKKKTTQMQEFEPQILSGTLEEVMHNSMMPYAEHVILERAIPRVEDGLKPVQRRILYTMMELGLSPDKPHRKCARIVGDCLGKYHPHGDSSLRRLRSFGTALLNARRWYGTATSVQSMAIYRCHALYRSQNDSLALEMLGIFIKIPTIIGST